MPYIILRRVPRVFRQASMEPVKFVDSHTKCCVAGWPWLVPMHLANPHTRTIRKPRANWHSGRFFTKTANQLTHTVVNKSPNKPRLDRTLHVVIIQSAQNVRDVTSGSVALNFCHPMRTCPNTNQPKNPANPIDHLLNKTRFGLSRDGRNPQIRAQQRQC